jgi:hydrogenase maturation protein HypF
MPPQGRSAAAVAGPAAERRRLRVTGTVQGVGFRPFVYRHAVALRLTGFVLNDSAGVLIEVQGAAAGLDELARRITEDPPPLARVAGVACVPIPVNGAEDGFHIVSSVPSAEPGAVDSPVSVDVATCQACLAEVDDPGDRRYRYPFTNCTNCGARYTIVLRVPYDRPATTMAGFAMCAACRSEYDDPSDRRFHAQPNACPACGPQLCLRRPDGTALSRADAALTRAIEALKSGAILAVKGLGGYHLAADARDAVAVGELRRRKHRDDKPFAVMVPDLASARELCQLTKAGEAALTSPRRPIVLATRRTSPPARVAPLTPGVAPSLPELGLILPYTPLHHLLLKGVARPLVMTSGNLSDEPIAHDDDDAVARLGPLVDALLTHDRPIHIRCDDSVARAGRRGVQLVRRSRGYTPEPMTLPPGLEGRRHILAVGAELKSTVTVAKERLLVCSHHIGDLEHLATYQSFLQAVEHLCHLYGVSPEVVAHDLHPEYLSTKFAVDLGLPTQAVQHHHAHIASCMAEHGHTAAVLGLAFDGLGLGTDGVLWGGEFLLADLAGFRRVGHLLPVTMPGGSAAIREPWRMAVAWVQAAAGSDAARRLGGALDPRASTVLDLVERGVGLATTSVGRLFDAIAAIVGVRSKVTYEGQAAIELEALAGTVPQPAAPRYPTVVDGAILDPRPLVAAVVGDVARGRPGAEIAAGFHDSLGRAAAALGGNLARAHRVDTVALSGGVFQNARLTDVVTAELATQGLHVLIHHVVPPNDGGISVGQAAIAAATRP